MVQVKSFYPLLIASLCVGLIAVCASVLARPMIIYNATDSLPHGFYRVAGQQTYERGDLVVFPVPEQVQHLVLERGWLRADSYLIKPVAAISGDCMTVAAGQVVVNNERFGCVKKSDKEGLPMPELALNTRLSRGEIAVLQKSDHSFDSRYFGLIDAREIIGTAVPLWLFSEPASSNASVDVESQEECGKKKGDGSAR